MSRPTKTARLRAFLEAHPRKWLSNRELAEVAGLRFGARIEILRNGWDGGRPMAIQARPVDAERGVWVYRFTGYAAEKPLPRPAGTMRQRFARLKAENERLRSMLRIAEARP